LLAISVGSRARILFRNPVTTDINCHFRTSDGWKKRCSRTAVGQLHSIYKGIRLEWREDESGRKNATAVLDLVFMCDTK
jgi:hypothetical protein